ncbi:MAG: ABC-type enterochelin transport system permease subunit [Algoriphagus sp.]|jgi:ABC-type enterochelin transport system permease subunit
MSWIGFATFNLSDMISRLILFEFEVQLSEVLKGIAD